jgi:hypothetical protein
MDLMGHRVLFFSAVPTSGNREQSALEIVLMNGIHESRDVYVIIHDLVSSSHPVLAGGHHRASSVSIRMAGRSAVSDTRHCGRGPAGTSPRCYLPARESSRISASHVRSYDRTTGRASVEMGSFRHFLGIRFLYPTL